MSPNPLRRLCVEPISCGAVHVCLSSANPRRRSCVWKCFRCAVRISLRTLCASAEIARVEALSLWRRAKVSSFDTKSCNFAAGAWLLYLKRVSQEFLKRGHERFGKRGCRSSCAASCAASCATLCDIMRNITHSFVRSKPQHRAHEKLT